MTIFVQTRPTPDDRWTDFDAVAWGMCLRTLTLSYAAPSRLEFYLTANEVTAPIPQNYLIKVWDDVGTDDNGDPLTSSNPLFLGTVITVAPGEHANQVIYRCFDPTYLVAKEVFVMSLPYESDGSPNAASVPRLVYNAPPSDDDYAFSVATNSTVAQLLSGLLDYTFHALKARDAAGSSLAYEASDLTAMTYVPQEKIVWESATVRSAVEQVWRTEPRFRMFFHPASKLWRFYKLNESPATAVHLNVSGLEVDGGGHPLYPYPCSSAEVNPSYEDCYTAVSISGPQQLGAAEFYWDDTLSTFGSGNIVPISTAVNLQTYTDSDGSHNANVYAEWQIVDTTKRAGGKLLRDWTQVATNSWQTIAVKQPIFMASWDYGASWSPLSGVVFDYLHGIVRIQGNGWPSVVREDALGHSITPGTTQTIFVPNAYKLVWAPYVASLLTRYPTSGYSGTAYDLYGMDRELRIYDETLAIGREFGVAVTSTARRAQFTALCQFLQETRRDVIFTGGIGLIGIDYSWCRLNRRVNIADAAGGTTGWEAINAVVTDVQYTYGDQPSTVLTFNGNWLEMYGEDMAKLRERLHIKAFQQTSYSALNGVPIIINTFRDVENYNGSHHQELASTTVYDPTMYVDNTGNVQKAEGR